MIATDYRLSTEMNATLARYQMRALVVGVIGLIACVAGLVLAPDHFFRGWLVGFVYCFGLALGSTAVLMLHHLSGGAWGLVIRRPLEAASRTMPLMALVFIPIFFGLPALYEWARPEAAHDVVIQLKTIYLNKPAFIIRQFIYFGIWLTMVYLLNKWSLREDTDRNIYYAKWLQRISGPGLVLYAITLTLAATDWIMSLDARWFSTVFAFMILAGQGLLTLSLMTATVILLSHAEPMRSVLTKRHTHDLGKLMLTFVMLWAYLSFSQLVIIWAGNLPEEITWYTRRLNNSWWWVGLILLLFHFVVPFLLLLSQELKKRPKLLTFVAIWCIAIRLVDIFWLIEPNFDKDQFRIHWMDFAGPIGIGGVWMAFFLWNLRQHPVMPVNAPDLEKALNHGRSH